MSATEKCVGYLNPTKRTIRYRSFPLKCPFSVSAPFVIATTKIANK